MLIPVKQEEKIKAGIFTKLKTLFSKEEMQVLEAINPKEIEEETGVYFSKFFTEDLPVKPPKIAKEKDNTVKVVIPNTFDPGEFLWKFNFLQKCFKKDKAELSDIFNYFQDLLSSIHDELNDIEFHGKPNIEHTDPAKELSSEVRISYLMGYNEGMGSFYTFFKSHLKSVFNSYIEKKEEINAE